MLVSSSDKKTLMGASHTITPEPALALETGKALVAEIDESFLHCTTKFSDRFVLTNSFIPLAIKSDGTLPPPGNLTDLLKSNIGYLFFDRTRIRPKGFAIGENVYTLSLAPGEEAVLEQKNFSKRQVTYEEETQQEKQFDLELSSTLSTELQESFQLQKNLSNTTGFTVGGGADGEIKGVPVNVNISYTNNVSEASNETKSRSVKESSTTSSKMASKYRTLHKVTFKIATEVGFEATSRRTIRNPNKCTPIQLQFFKMLQLLEMSQERYGVRLCWTPTVSNPALGFAERIRKGKEDVLNTELRTINIPPRPQPPVSGPPRTFETAPPLDTSSKWGVTCDMRFDFDVPIKMESGYVWDKDADFVTNSVNLIVENVNRGYGFHVVGRPWQDGDTVFVKVHLGVDPNGLIPIGGCGKIRIVARAIGIPTPSPAQMQEWQNKLNEWQAIVNNLTQEARERGTKNADAWEQDVKKRLNPIEEITQIIVRYHNEANPPDENWEIDSWRTIFDWSSASFLLYPGWWSDSSMKDYTKDATDFINASWAKLYLPIKIGSELLALRWIFGKSMDPLDPARESVFNRLVNDLNTFRDTQFGPKETNIVSDGECGNLREKYLCLGRWNDLLPTDGTHIEVIQSTTNACDQHTQKELDAVLDSELQNIELKKKISSNIRTPVNINLNLDMNGNAKDETTT
jgi:hypothetical protein